MLRDSFRFLVTSLAFLLPVAQSLGQGVIKVEQSKPVTVNEARFVTVAETEWLSQDLQNGDQCIPIDLQLRITNLKKTKMVFHTFGDFGPTIRKADGSAIHPSGGADSWKFTKPIMLAPGASYSIIRRAEMRWDSKTKTSSLVYRDGTGQWEVFGPLPPGKYRVGFWYSTKRYRSDYQKNPVEGLPSWAGDAETPEVAIEVIKPPSPKKAD